VQDCVRVIAACAPCQRTKTRPLPLPLKPTPKFEAPFQCWAIDYLPTLPLTTTGYRHLLLCVDSFSKWIELIPMKTKSSEEVAEVLRHHIIARFGVPRELRMDRGKEFAGEVISTL
jgi:Integrase core domain.